MGGERRNTKHAKLALGKLDPKKGVFGGGVPGEWLGYVVYQTCYLGLFCIFFCFVLSNPTPSPPLKIWNLFTEIFPLPLPPTPPPKKEKNSHPTPDIFYLSLLSQYFLAPTPPPLAFHFISCIKS